MKECIREVHQQQNTSNYDSQKKLISIEKSLKQSTNKNSLNSSSKCQEKKILCVDDQICFFSVLDAEAFYKAGKGTIGRVAAGKRKTYRGKKFEFINTTTSKDKRAEVN